MIDKLENYKKRNDFLLEEISKPEIISNQAEWLKLVKEQAGLVEYAGAYDKYKPLLDAKAFAEEVLKSETDAEMLMLAEGELNELNEKLDKMEEEIKVLLLPKDENDESNVILEVRSGAGGDESSLFGAELLRMYTRYAERMGWKVEVAEYSETEVGGLREGVIIIKGKGAYKRLKFESGVHRVQRVPETESQGRVHTSTSTVAVLPEAETIDFEIKDTDLKIDTYRSGGAGGQHVNTSDSAVRITHLPTGVVVACQDERSQLKNRDKAMGILASKLKNFYQEQADKEYSNRRKVQVGTGDRSERIRTYNFPQGRVTDHRIGLTMYNIADFMEGCLDEMLNALHTEDVKLKLENLVNEQ
ncbi:MAG: peptide chain release factor 1 [Firmicutes bacterium]|nr:peptide chain release factor 1 [Bacillota bacterium]